MRAASRTVLVTLCLIVLSIAARDRSSSPGEPAAGAAPPPILRRGNGGDPHTLDPALAEDEHAFNVLADLYEGLVSLDAGGKVIGGVAERWTIGPGGLRYSFHLDPEARWSSGETVTAQDFVAGFRRSLSASPPSSYAFLLQPIRNAQQVADGSLPVTALAVFAPDEQTLVIELASPAPELLASLTMPVAYPVPPVDDTGSRWYSDPEEFVGNGPYVLDEWQPASHIRLVKNARYRHADTVAIETVRYLPIADPHTELRLFRSSELDITATVPPGSLGMLRERMPEALRLAPKLGLYYLAFDLTEPPFDELALRKALTMAIDRHALVRVIGRGEIPAYGLVPEGIPDYTPARFDWRSLPQAEREARARKLLATSRFANSDSVQLNLIYDVGDIHEQIAVAVRGMWRDVLDIDVTLDKREWKYFLTTRENRKEWQVMRFAWTGDYNFPSTFTDILLSDSPQNLPGYRSAEYDNLIRSGREAEAASDQMRLFAAAEAAMLDDCPLAPLYFFAGKHLVNPQIRGFEHNALDRHLSRFLDFAPTSAD